MYNILLSKKNVLLAGDFNAVTKKKDRISSNERNLKGFELEWKKFFKNFRLEEINYSLSLANDEKMTWHNNGSASRIDRVYLSKNFHH